MFLNRELSNRNSLFLISNYNVIQTAVGKVPKDQTENIKKKKDSDDWPNSNQLAAGKMFNVK